MKVVIQRVSEASVLIEDEEKSRIGVGVLILLGIEETDHDEDIAWLSRKIVNMRIFPDQEGVMNESLLNKNGEALVISQFTLHANTRKGNRPSYIKAANPDIAISLYKKFIHTLEADLGKPISTGEFGRDMKISLTNDGPVTILIDSKNRG